MDEICEALTNKICSMAGNGYGIFYEDELLDAFPGDENKDRETLEAALKKLVKGGYIDVKYARGSAFCLLGIKKFEAPKELPEEIETEAAVEANYDKKLWAANFVAAFLGGAVGSIICGLIFLFAGL